MRPLLLTLFTLFLAIACNNRSTVEEHADATNELKQFDWLLHSWKSNSPEGDLFETWSILNDTVYSGTSYVIAKSDTVFFETITLEIHESEVYYIPMVSKQNEGKRVEFKLVKYDGNSFTFENKDHDFPQRIIYSHPAPDSLHAAIEGTQKGQFRKEEFGMRKMK